MLIQIGSNDEYIEVLSIYKLSLNKDGNPIVHYNKKKGKEEIIVVDDEDIEDLSERINIYKSRSFMRQNSFGEWVPMNEVKISNSNSADYDLWSR